MSNYGIDEIQSLDFRTGVRTRINMYLGTDDNEGTYQALKEIINNATDEALAGYGQEIKISISEKENYASVTDMGRGVPFGIREDGENVLVSIYSKSHTGGKFGGTAYKNASGLNGIGAKCVCLSAEKFEVQSVRDKTMAKAYFEKGILISYKELKNSSLPNGTYVRFKPDKEVFKNGEIGYSYDRVCNDIKNISYLYPGIKFIVKNDDTDKMVSYCAKNGIKDFIQDHIESPLHPHIIYDSIEENGDKLEIAFQWGSKNESCYVFVNGLLCPEGGKPVTGAKTSITRTFNSLAKQNFNGDNIRHNLFYVINCSVANPSFANQTKTKINNQNLQSMASSCFSNALRQMATKYRDEFNTIAEMLVKVERAEAAADKARQNVLNAQRDIVTNQKKKVFASDKLKDAEFLGQDSTLLIVEGNSAASSMASARDSAHYGILAIKGKILNCLSNPEDKIYENEEIKLLLSAMNIVPGAYNSKNLRYGRIAICSDADSDGYHIGLLIMAALHYLAPQFITENRLCWLRSPLHIVKSRGKEYYFYNDEEFMNSPIKGETSRIKGLGTLSADQAHNAMFTEEFQRMDVLTPDENYGILLEELMGEDVEPRRDFVFTNIDFSTVHE